MEGLHHFAVGCIKTWLIVERERFMFYTAVIKEIAQGQGTFSSGTVLNRSRIGIIRLFE
jgi:hypothetical protein